MNDIFRIVFVGLFTQPVDNFQYYVNPVMPGTTKNPGQTKLLTRCLPSGLNNMFVLQDFLIWELWNYGLPTNDAN